MGKGVEMKIEFEDFSIIYTAHGLLEKKQQPVIHNHYSPPPPPPRTEVYNPLGISEKRI